MSEKTLTELICKFRRQSPGTAEHYSLAELVNARIRRAETAEKAMESWLAWWRIGYVDGTWDAFVKAVADYKSAKEAVRKLEESK